MFFEGPLGTQKTTPTLTEMFGLFGGNPFIALSSSLFYKEITMRSLSTILIVLVFTLFVQAQNKVNPPPNELLGRSLDELLQPAKSDKEEAKRLGFKVFRILPRETYDGKIDIRGGGAYYSFITRLATVSRGPNPPNYVLNQPAPVYGLDRPMDEKTNTQSLTNLGFRLEDKRDDPSLPNILDPHYYGYGSDIELQQGKFTVGFAGADYGFLYDLGEVPLDIISTETPEAIFLTSYEPPSKITEIRAEQTKLFSTSAYEANGFGYKRLLPVVVGHSYILRSINFDRSDILVALKVYRQDTDGSMIVFWKKLKTFEKPDIDRK